MGKEIMIRDLTFSYGGNGNQLEHISLDIAAGEVIVMTGPSGSGKSSLTRVINGLIPYFYEGELSGEVFVDGKPLKEIPSWERGKIAGNVFQDPRSQFFANEVAGEIAFGCENYGYSHEENSEPCSPGSGRHQNSGHSGSQSAQPVLWDAPESCDCVCGGD